MRGKPFVEEGEGAVNRERASPEGRRKGGGGERREPRSVLDQRRSPSPPTSTSALSSSLGGGGGSTDTAGVAAVSETPLPQKWVPSETTSAAMGVEGEGRREDWMSELQLQNIPMEIGLMGGSGGGGKCETGAEDWESMFSETPAASLGQDQSFLRWFVGDEEDSSSIGFKQHQQLHHNHHHRMPSSLVPPSHSDDFGAGAAGGFGLIDQGFPLDPIEGFVGAPLTAASTSVTSGGGFPVIPISTPPTLSNVKNPFLAAANSNPLFQSPVTAASSFPFQQQPQSQPAGPAMFFSENMDETLFPPNHILNHHQQTHGSHNPSFFMPLNLYAQQEPYYHNHHQPSAVAPHQHQHQHPLLLPSHPKRHQSMTANPCGQIGSKPLFSIPGQDHFLRRQQQPPPSFGSYQQRLMKPKLAMDELPGVAAHQQHHLQQHQSLVDQLFKAAELIETGNYDNSREILARLNHQLSPHGKPLIRSAFYFKEALNAIIGTDLNPVASPPPFSSKSPPQPQQLTPLDVVLKLNAYKNFSEISPVVQFTNFTCIQALLEELAEFDRIHIVDFDIGVGGQWSSFMQELAQRQQKQQHCASSSALSLKITALVTPSLHSHLELILTRENLTNFAMEHGIPFEFNILSLDIFDPATILALSSSEAIAVNIPVGGPSPSWTATTLHFIKQLSPKIVVSVDHNCDRSNDLPFSQHFLNALHSYTILLESIEAATAGSSPEVSSKIEKYLIQGRIENVVSSSSQRRMQEKKKTMMVPWRVMFASAGFVPIQLSNFTETQAECVLKRIQVRGFHVEKRQSSLVLFWQLSELVSVSAWKCC